MKWVFGVIVAGILIILTIFWQISGQMVHPNRRPLQDYHRDWLNQPATLGLRISQFPCGNGQAPCLFIAPDGQLKPGEKGQSQRRQLEENGYRLAPYGETRGILVLLYGRDSRKEDLIPIAERFAAAGFKCVIPDLPSHGDSPVESLYYGSGDFEARLPRMVLEDARKYFNEWDNPVGIWGLSMGGAIAIKAAASSPETWNSLVIVSSFDSLQDIARDRVAKEVGPLSGAIETGFSLVSRLRGLKLDEVKPVEWAASINKPVLVAHGDRDALISIQHGHRLFEAFASASKQWITVPDATHDNILVTPMPLYEQMSAWFIKTLGRTGSGG